MLKTSNQNQHMRFDSLEYLIMICQLSTLFLLSCTLIFCHTKATQSPIYSSCNRRSDDPKSLANCAVGFGKNATGGRDGQVYTVTDDSDTAINPKEGTLRYAVTRNEPLWIVFERDMVINLKHVLLITSNKTIDGSSAKVEIASGPCIAIEHAEHVIVHGMIIHQCQRVKPGLVQISPDRHRMVWQEECDGDGIRVSNSTHIWIDLCHLFNATDDLVDLTRGSKHITISNSQFSRHEKDVLKAQRKTPVQEYKLISITVANNLFSDNVRQWVPRVRYSFQRVPNHVNQWISFSIGGRLHPTSPDEGNYIIAPNDPKIS